MLFNTSREAFSFAQKFREKNGKDIVVFEKKGSFIVCFENEFFNKDISYKKIICYLAHPNNCSKIVADKDYFENVMESREIRLTFNYKRK